MSGATWVYKGMYGNGTAFAPFMDLYECSNCKATIVTVLPKELAVLFDECPECHSQMKKEGEAE